MFNDHDILQAFESEDLKQVKNYPVLVFVKNVPPLAED